MRALIIGTGAGGNKSVINLVEDGIVSAEDIVLFNTTEKDIPEKYRDKFILIEGSSLGGCGKERKFGQELMLKALKDQTINLNGLYNPTVHKMAIIITSTEGGTGSGSAPVIARYFSQMVKVPTHLIGFTGFGDDGRGLQNTVMYAKDIVDGLTVHLIANKKFLKEANNSPIDAERLANKELAARLAIITGKVLVESEQNIDDMDLFKLVNTPGYEEVAYRVIDDKIKSPEQFNDIIKDMISESKSIDVTKPSQLRMGVIFNIPESEYENVDFGLNLVKQKYGTPFEFFKHIQYIKEMPKFVAFVCSGIKLPIEEIEEIYQEYLDASAQVSKDSDSFYKAIQNIQPDKDTTMFDACSVSQDQSTENNISAKDFFDSFN